MADRLDIMSVRVQDKSAEIIFMIMRAKAGRAVVTAAGFHGGIVKGANAVAGFR